MNYSPSLSPVKDGDRRVWCLQPGPDISGDKFNYLSLHTGLWPEPETKLILAAGVTSHLTTGARVNSGAPPDNCTVTYL